MTCSRAAFLSSARTTSQGRTGLKHIMLGSKAEQVVNLSPIPVTIVKAKKEKSESKK